MENEKELLVAIEHLKARNMSAKHIDMAITALERQIPKKPCRISEIDENDNALVECPICHDGNDYAINRIKSGYCWNCGQKLDWETDF